MPVYNHAALTRQCLDALFSDPPETVTQAIIVATCRGIIGQDRLPWHIHACFPGARKLTYSLMIFNIMSKMIYFGCVNISMREKVCPQR